MLLQQISKTIVMLKFSEQEILILTKFDLSKLAFGSYNIKTYIVPNKYTIGM